VFLSIFEKENLLLFQFATSIYFLSKNVNLFSKNSQKIHKG